MALINCLECGREISDKAQNCIGCGAPVVQKSTAPESVYYDADSDCFHGTMSQVVKLAMTAVQEHRWTIEQANEAIGLVTFKTSISWGSWSGITGSLNITEVAPNAFRVVGTGKQNISGGQLIAFNIGNEAQSKAKKAIETMKRLAKG